MVDEDPLLPNRSDTDMCAHGNFLNSCSACTTDKQWLKIEKNLMDELHQAVIQEDFGNSPSLSEQRKEAMEKELDEATKFMNGFKRSWFVVGGMSVELSTGKFTRDHEDIDVAIYHDDLLDFFDYASQNGYRFTDWKHEEITSKQELAATETHAIIHKIDTNSSGPQELDIVFLERDKEGRVDPLGNNQFFPAWLYNNPPYYTTISGERTPLQPKEVVLFCKISRGKQKDIKEAQAGFASLNDDERRRFEGYIQSFGISFEIDGKKVTDVDNLFKIADELEVEEKENFFKDNIKSITEKNRKFFDRIIEKLVVLVAEHTAKKELYETLIKECADEYVSIPKSDIDNFADQFLFKGESLTPAQLKIKAYQELDLKKYVQAELQDRIWRMPRWKTETDPHVAVPE